MATLEEHIVDCLDLIGNGFREVHEWMDETAKSYPPEKYGTHHRMERHNLKGIHQVYEKFGSLAAVAAVIHFLRDRNGFSPTHYDLQEALKNGISEVNWDTE